MPSLLMMVLSLYMLTSLGCGTPLGPGKDTTRRADSPPPANPPVLPAPDWSRVPTPVGAIAFYEAVPAQVIPPSRYVFFNDTAFSLQVLRWSSLGEITEYPGQYARREDSIVLFRFGWSSVMGPAEATGTMSNGLLEVKYGEAMSWDGFEDGVYVRRDVP